MQKKRNLTAALSDPAPEHPASSRTPPAARAPYLRPDREDKTNITGYFDKPVKWELQDLATERSRRLGHKITLQNLLTEALNDLFKKYGKAEIVIDPKREDA